MRCHLILLLSLVSYTLPGQVDEDFSDGEFETNPSWLGNSGSFIVDDLQQLQLNETGSGTAFLSTMSHVNREATWQFDVAMSFNPSGQNFGRVYLISDQQQLSSRLKGYYVNIGGTDDEVSLYRQDLSSHLELIDGDDDVTDTSQLRISIKVTRDSGGQWKLYLDRNLDHQYQLSGQVFDDTYQTANYFGVYCQFTSSRSQGFHFDNFKVNGQLHTDAEPPQLESVRALDRYRVELVFDEPIENPQFRVVGLGMPKAMVNFQYNTWHLEFPFPFENAIEYVLEMNVKDLYGNTLQIQRSFQFWSPGTASRNEIIVTEIMADPSPPLGLPELEYLEIYNRSDSAINLKNWILADENNQTKLPDYLLLPANYLVLHPDAAAAFPDDTDHLSLSPWPALNNTGDHISLADSSHKLIHFVSYTDNWYRSGLKQHGGWSLEMIDLNYPCSGAENWVASESTFGGSPGRANSVAMDNPDLTPPVIINTIAETAKRIVVCFDQALDEPLGTTQTVTLDPVVRIDTFFINSSPGSCLTILLHEGLKAETIYQVNTTGFADCNQNISLDKISSAPVGLVQQADSNDVVLNEVLFNPRPFGEKFVEIFNRSLKVVNLKNWKLARWQNQTLVDFTVITDLPRTLYPGEYLVLTEDKTTLLGHYPSGDPFSILEVDKLPSMGEKQGSVVLLTADGQITDAMNYHQNMHHPLLFDQNGVSLERADPDGASDNLHNWFSGSESNGYASPGFKNSQFIMVNHRATFNLDPGIISPTSSRFPSYATITFSLEAPGNSGSIMVFNRQGYLVKTIVNNSLLPREGLYRWDGTGDNFKPVPIGQYIIYFRVSGKSFGTQSWRKTIAVIPDF